MLMALLHNPPSLRSYRGIVITSLDAAAASLARLFKVNRVKIGIFVPFQMSALLQDPSVVFVLMRHVLRTGSAKVDA